jgi:hypothetical protein
MDIALPYGTRSVEYHHSPTMTRRRLKHDEQPCQSYEEFSDHRPETAPLSPRTGPISVQLITRPSPIVSSSHSQRSLCCIAQEKENDPLLSFPSFEDEDFENCQSSMEELNITDISSNPIRNLMNTFDSFDIAPGGSQHHLQSSLEEALDATKHSPSSVADFHDRPSETSSIKSGCTDDRRSPISYLAPKPITIPRFHLHSTLQVNLKQPVVDRCSLYTVIHDVNKEVLGMLQHDKYSMSTVSTATQSVEEEYSVLLMAVEGPRSFHHESRSLLAPDSIMDSAMVPGHSQTNTPFSGSGHRLDMALATIDEEMFILRAIASRSPEEMNIRACPATFSEAMGEVEPTENRTQLWKPGRSWWEAKSGKNPWIEASSHNKRWR